MVRVTKDVYILRLSQHSSSTLTKFSSPLQSCSSLQSRFLRHYSSRAQAESSAPLPVSSDLPSFAPRGSLKKRSPPSQNSQRPQPSRDVLVRTTVTGDTPKSSPSNPRVDVLDCVASPSTVVNDDPPSIPPEIHDTSLLPVTRSSIRQREDPLTQGLFHIYVSSPQASIQSLVACHDTFPDLQSSQSYNFLLRLAIRHSAFGTAHALLRSMRTSRVPEDPTTWKLCVRLLVREGRWPDAYNLVHNLRKHHLPHVSFVSDGVPVAVWAELLGTVKRRAFRGLRRMCDPGMYNLARYRLVMRLLPKIGASMSDTPPPQAVYMSVAALLRMQERESARKVAAHFVTMGPKGSGLRLVHLHVAAEPGRESLVTFSRALQDLRGFRVLCPELEPNSTTLFLLLGHLKGAKKCGTIGDRLVRWFRRRWGNSVVSCEVERRVLALAVKEKQVGLIKKWMTCVQTRRKIWWMWSVEREVVDGGVPRRRSARQRPEVRLAAAGKERLPLPVDRLLHRASRVLKSEGKALGRPCLRRAADTR
jgi:hypothetical protein